MSQASTVASVRPWPSLPMTTHSPPGKSFPASSSGRERYSAVASVVTPRARSFCSAAGKSSVCSVGSRPGRAHRGPQRFGRQRRRAARSQHDGVKAEGRGAAQQRTHVAGVLHALQRQDAVGRVQRVSGRHGRLKQRKHALVGLGTAELFRHMGRDLGGVESCQFRRFGQRRRRGIHHARRAVFRQFQAEFWPFGKEHAVGGTLLFGIAHSTGVFDLGVIAAGDRFHCSAPFV